MIYIHLLIMILSFIACFVFFLSFAVEGDESNSCFATLLISFIVLIAATVLFIVGNTKCENSELIIDEKPYAVESIVALNDNNMTYGRMYVRRGYFEEDLYYQYIVKLNNGGFKSNKVKANNTTLFYDTENYRVEWYKATKNWLYFKNEKTINKIYIPEGSITDEYYVDLS